MTKIPKGRYFLGDVCYCFGKSWGDILDKTDFFNDALEHNGQLLIAFGTAYGDGTYFDQFGNKFPVDAGLIGLTPVSMIEKEGGENSEWLKSAGIFIDVGEDFYAENKGGDMKFGPHEILTLTEEEDEEESDPWDDDEEDEDSNDNEDKSELDKENPPNNLTTYDH